MTVPDFLTHYYEKAAGPFANLSRLPAEQAEQILAEIRQAGNRFASRRADDYLRKRRELEATIRKLFEDKGGQPRLPRPHYLILGACPWVKEWYVDGQEVRLQLADIPAGCVSFTYGDSFPAMNVQDGKPYRGKVYTLHELGDIIGRYGLPQEWNPDGRGGPERYIEAQVWEDGPVQPYLQTRNRDDELRMIFLDE